MLQNIITINGRPVLFLFTMFLFYSYFLNSSNQLYQIISISSNFALKVVKTDVMHQNYVRHQICIHPSRRIRMLTISFGDQIFLSLNQVTKKFQLPQWMMTKNIWLPNHMTTIFWSSPNFFFDFCPRNIWALPKKLIFQSRVA